MDVTKLPRVGGRDNMLPRAGESALDQLRERVQGLEEEPAAATFDAEGEPVVEMDEGDEVAARPGWTIHDDDTVVRVGIAKVTDDLGDGMYAISEAWSNAGTPELKTNGFEGRAAYAIDQTTTWAVDDYIFYIQIQKVAGGSEYYIERSAGPGDPVAGNEASQSPPSCVTIYRYDHHGHCIGWFYAVYPGPTWTWYSPPEWGCPQPGGIPPYGV